VRFQVLTAVNTKFKAFWDVVPCSHIEVDQHFIILMMEAVCTSETSVNFCVTTWRYIPEDSKLQLSELIPVSVFSEGEGLHPFDAETVGSNPT
jgi:hypothetical protein